MAELHTAILYHMVLGGTFGLFWDGAASPPVHCPKAFSALSLPVPMPGRTAAETVSRSLSAGLPHSQWWPADSLPAVTLGMIGVEVVGRWTAIKVNSNSTR